jgi:hypothetical protein
MAETQAPESGANEISLGEKYFRERMPSYGVNDIGDSINQVKLWRTDTSPGATGNKLVEFPVFSAVPEGIKIIVYTIDRSLITYKPKQETEADGEGVIKRTWSKDYCIIRLHTPRINEKTKKDQKYHLPKDAGTHPFFPPPLLDKYDKKEKIKTLVLTEGYFKAFKASQYGLDIVGLSSITHMVDKMTGGLHSDILKLIRMCNVENVIWLADGDCNTISLKALEAGEDVWKRPNLFYSSAAAFRRLLDDYSINRYFSYIDSINIEGMPKGLDDLLISMKGKEVEVVEDLLALSNLRKRYFYCEDITAGAGKVHRHFRLNDVNAFVEYHCEVIQEMAKKTSDSTKRVQDLKSKPFVWCGTKYQWNSEKNACETIIPADATKYFRVGDQYHEKVEVPNKYGELEKRFDRRQKQTIIDDQTKDIMQHIPKYFAFCNVPNHTNYQPVIHGCYNMYFPFDHEAEEYESEDDFQYTMKFLKHIFGDKEIKVKHKTKGEIIVNELDLGLDYIQLLYQLPQQILPILCLVSKENNTGKSTFAFWLKELFTQNVAIVGNQDLANEFNAFWAGKLLIICDEAKIDKQVVVEKIKSLSTAKKITVNAKGKDQNEIDFFGKFLMLTNNEDNFIYAGEEDVRYWIRKVPVITELFVGLLDDMKREIPYFLNFLNKRKMKTENLHRAWFHPELIKTEALKKVILFSKSTVEKEIRTNIRETFLDHGVSEIMMTPKMIKEHFLPKKSIELSYLRRVLDEELKLDTYHELEYEGKFYATTDEVMKVAAYAGTPFGPDRKFWEHVKKKYKTKNFSFPKWESLYDNGKHTTKRVWVHGNGRPYIFRIEEFLLKAEIEGRWIDADTLNDVREHEREEAGPPLAQHPDAGQTAMTLSSADGSNDDLPF